ncbi:unnamed protein product [Medioppia subpectinata]|uniref:Nuclear receptor domain-containing protein n=1 Tax=Medioppia subpectinata TaxID=1979941 RepID=A0A7R9Q7S6_9ACAR|nr:unnamed protein product [Medioppia subpectinata]CAG2116060.1 unnamed protein product [Medioppia subpectinata]
MFLPYGCPSAGKCKITTITRKYCPKCRFDKCLAVGMKRDSNNSETQTMITTITPLYKEIIGSNGLNELEIQRITELSVASDVYNYPLAKYIIEIRDENELFRIIKVKSEHFIRDTIKFTKGLLSFANTCPDDQYVLFKSGAFEVIYMQYLDTYDRDREIFHIHLDKEHSLLITLQSYKETDFNYYNMFKRFLDSIIPELHSDPIIMNLLLHSSAQIDPI